MGAGQWFRSSWRNNDVPHYGFVAEGKITKPIREFLHRPIGQLYRHHTCRFWTLKILAFSSGMTASYAVSIRQASALPAASFRFHLTMDTLAVRLTVPPVGPVEDLHLQVGAPCRAHQNKSPVCFQTGRIMNSGGVLLSHTAARVVSSARRGLTSEFGMGSGVTPVVWPPKTLWTCQKGLKSEVQKVGGKSCYKGKYGQAARPISTS